jgi:FkbM family methyltransferase
MKNRFFFRAILVLFHPIRVLKHLFSKQEDYSRIQLSELQKYLVAPKVIIEAGAADGIDTSEFLISFPEAKIFAVEPVNQQFVYLREKFLDQENIELFNIAFSEENGVGELNIGADVGQFGGMGSSSMLEPMKHQMYFPSISFNRKQPITIKTLETFMIENQIERVDLLWLDIQGKELDVLKASERALVEKIKLLHIEISRVSLYKGMPKEREIRKFLKDLGFICVVDKVGAISGNALYLNNRFTD